MPQDAREVDQIRDRFLSLASDWGQPISLRKTWGRRFAAFQLAAHHLLERPTGILEHFYHFAVFGLIFLDYVLNSKIDGFYKICLLHHFLALFLLAEFATRLWAVGVDAHYRDLRGRMAFIYRPTCLIDMVVLGASLLLLLIFSFRESTDANSITTNGMDLDIISFLPMLRLLTVDRQMSAFTLVRQMVKRSRFELLSAYYITLMLFMLMSFFVFTSEQWHTETNVMKDGQPTNSTFENFGDSLWFSVVTILTIGYGDIVPRSWLTKLVICLFAYLGISMFSAASGLLGVGMSLMLSNERQQRQQSKTRDLAARLIQSWIRFHLITKHEIFMRIRIYRKFCTRLQRVEERIRRAREAVRIASERKQSRIVHLLQKYSPMAERQTWPGAQTVRPEKRIEILQLQQEEQIEELEEDEERILDFYYNQRSHSTSLLSGRSEEANGLPADAALNGRHQAILRMCYFFVFISLRKRFKRMRNPYELMDAEAELCELEHQRLQKFKELEMRLDSQLGTRPNGTMLAPENQVIRQRSASNGWKRDNGIIGIMERMELAEQKIAAMERKAEFIEHLSGLILNRFQQKIQHVK